MRRVSVVLVVVVAVAAALLMWMRNAPPPPPPDMTPPPPSANAPVVQPPAARSKVTVYFARQKSGNGEWVLVPVSRAIEPSAPAAEASIEALLKGPTADEKAAGLLAPLPKGTRLRGITKEGDTFTVDFSRELQEKFNGGAEWEEVVLGAIVNTLCELEGTDAVSIRIEGAPVESIGGHLAADQPLRRNSEIVDRGKR